MSRATNLRHVAAGFRIRNAPVPPGNLVVLAIGIVVARLRPPEFVPGEQHRRAVSKQNRRQHGSVNARPDVQNRLICRRSFNSPVRGIVLAVTVFIVFAVGLVVPLGIADHIRKRETVV